MEYNRVKPYNDLPLLPPNNIDLETKAILKQGIASGRALAELKGAGDVIPNQAIVVNLIGLQEAKLSSEIENIVTTNDELYRAFSEQDDQAKHDPATKEVLHYNSALWYGYDRLKQGRPLSTRLFEEIVQVIRKNEDGIRRTTGTKIEDSNREVIYTPPEGETIIRDKLANLEAFIHSDLDVDPLVKMAVMHYQFEAIHPFSDGNGRTGRILNILYLISQNLLDIPILYLSRYFIENRSEYYKGLRQITENNEWEAWILYILKAVEKTSLETHQQVLEIRNLMLATSERVKAELPKTYRKELIELLFAHPYCKIKFLQDAGLGSRETASKYLMQLTKLGIVSRVDVGRDAYFINTEFYKLLTK